MAADSNQPNDQLSLRLNTIRQAWADLRIASIRKEHGQRSDVLVVNDELVFRFPHTGEDAVALATEAAILRSVNGRLPIPIPAPVLQHVVAGSSSDSFLAYHRLPGQPLDRQTMHSLEASVRGALASQLGAFLHALHSLPVQTLPAGLVVEDTRKQWLRFYARVRSSLYPSMRHDVRRSIDEFFRMHFATRPLDREFTPSLRHGDFGPTNILYDPQTSSISGVIDFGSAGLGDPAVDIAALIGPVSYGETFAELLMPTYPGVDALLERARFYAGTFAFQEALWGLDHNDPNAFQHGMANYV